MNKKFIRFSIILSSFLILFLLVFYIFQLGKLTETNYTIKNCQEEIRNLKEENMALAQKSLPSFSLVENEEKIGTLGFIKTQTVKYIPISVNYLAGEIR